MNNDKKQQAKELYFQTGLNKTQIANLLGISRRSLHYWIREGNWDRLKRTSEVIPSLIAENCYHILGDLTEHYLSENRVTERFGHKDADTIQKMVSSINKLGKRTTNNECFELFAHFLDYVGARNAELARTVSPLVDGYLFSRGSVRRSQLMPDHFTDTGRIPLRQEDARERQLDNRDLFDWENERLDILETAKRAQAMLDAARNNNNNGLQQPGTPPAAA